MFIEVFPNDYPGNNNCRKKEDAIGYLSAS